MILLIYGTRPEYIKIKPLLEEFKNVNIPYKTLFTGQHSMLNEISSDYYIPFESYNENNRLNDILINCLKHSYIFDNIKYVLVQGDTTSALGYALSAFNHKIPIIHLEAGLRSCDLDNPYPEEANRLIISNIASIHFCPTSENANNVQTSIKHNSDIYVVGNSGLDNIVKYRREVKPDKKVLITLHRRENHDIMDLWFNEIKKITQLQNKFQFILPIHPNPNVQKYKYLLENIPNLKIVDPLSHDDIMKILVKCEYIITDSGGLQEESCFLHIPCYVCRKTTERVESLNISTHLIKNPTDMEQMILNYERLFSFKSCPYGNGYTSKKISKILKEKYNY